MMATATGTYRNARVWRITAFSGVALLLLVIVESSFLVAVTVHAMLGVRGILLDLGPSQRARRRIDRGLTLVGIATIAYGFVLIGVLASRA